MTGAVAELLADTGLYEFDDTNEMGLCALAVTRELRSRLVMLFGADLASARAVAQVCDDYAREHIEECQEDDEEGDEV